MSVDCRECGEKIQASSITRVQREIAAQSPTTDSPISTTAEDLSLSVFRPVVITAGKDGESPREGESPSVGVQQDGGGDPDPSEMSARAYVASRILLVAREASHAPEHGPFPELSYPACEECADRLFHELSGALEDAEAERAAYARALKEAEERLASLGDGESARAAEDALTSEIEALEATEAELSTRLEAALADRAHLDEMQRQLDRDESQLRQEEAQYWNDHNALALERHSLAEETSACSQRARAAESRLQSLSRSNVFNDTFHIWHSGHFGTINGFRLGRLQGSGVEWAEINAAYGQAALLLHSLAARLDFAFRRFRVVPMGSFSRMAVEGAEGKSYELFHDSQGWKLWNSHFDKAQVAFLDCVGQLMQHAASVDPEFSAPYVIDADRIDGLSVKAHFNSDEKWTKALKYLLTNLKFLLFFASKQK